MSQREPWSLRPPLDQTATAELREAMIFDYCKWDPQVGDTATLCPHPLVLRRETAQDLFHTAEALYAETLAAEAEILSRHEMLDTLALPRAIRRALPRTLAGSVTTAAGRVMRFDFHPTTEGWRVSEVNCDVPGGYVETRGLGRLLAAHYPDCAPAGDPIDGLLAALRRAVGHSATIGLVHATAYTDDRQVMVLLARAWCDTGGRALLLAPDAVQWAAGRPRTQTADGIQELNALVRFFPAEWLPNLGWRYPWRAYFQTTQVPCLNPAATLVCQSKRWALLWPQLRTPLPTWRRLMPECRDPRSVRSPAADWVFKPALGRVGEAVLIPGLAPAERRLETQWRQSLRIEPQHWVAQRRFDPTPWIAADGVPRHVCLGVYVIDGRAAGIYGRAAERPLIDGEARDVGVLVENFAHE